MPGKRRVGFEPHEKEFLESLATAFKQIRAEAGLTHRQAAAMIPTTTSRISEMENAKTDICVLTLQKWAHAYGYSIELSFVPFEEEELGETG